MLELKGKFNTAKVFANAIDQTAVSQIINICNQKAFEESRIRIMPDVHAGKGCTIGTTMTITDKVTPNLVGVDIGCGMEVLDLGKNAMDFEMLDRIIHERIPAGFSIREKAHPFLDNIGLKQLHCYDQINEQRAELSLGSLGGGNHFIEVDKSDAGTYYLVIHSGSRHLGVDVDNYYQNEAHRKLSSKFDRDAKTAIIERMKSEGRTQDIQSELQKMTSKSVPKELAYCEDELFDQYLHDMRITQLYAMWNRRAMADEILKGMGIPSFGGFTTIHNYIDVENMILRKGAVSAQKGERLIIPINMRDGSLICIGKGNPDWNYSAPHGAGRLLSRSAAKQEFTVEEFKEQMKGIFTTSVNSSTLDESPMSYKPIEDIVGNIDDTVDIVEIIKPVYNFKAGE